MSRLLTILAALWLTIGSNASATGQGSHHGHDNQETLSYPTKHISFETRAHWMRVAIQALYDLVSPCPFQAYGTAIVNHTAGGDGDGLGRLVCIGANGVQQTGNPTLHGEINAIKNCTAILTDPAGSYRLSPAEAHAAYADLTLYTTAEACPMCAASMRWAGFEGYVYATSIDGLVGFGWHQITISSREVFARSSTMGPRTELVADVLANETDPLLSWQYNAEQPCPKGCSRDKSSGHCEVPEGAPETIYRS